MEASDELLTIAELAIGLAGFSGIVVAFSHRKGLRENDRFRFITLFLIAMLALILAFVPFGFHHAGQAGPALWKGSSAVMLVFSIGITWFVLAHLPDFPVDQKVPKPVLAVTWGTAILRNLIEVANIIGWPLESGPLLYPVALILWLMMAAVMFAFLVIFGGRD